MLNCFQNYDFNWLVSLIPSFLTKNTFSPFLTVHSSVDLIINYTIMIPDIDSIINDFVKVCTLAGLPLNRSDFYVEKSLAPHKPPSSLPPGKMAVYIFYWRGECLKVGKVGPKSQARYVSQHYSPSSSQSNLAKSILSSQGKLSISGLNEYNVGKWIKDNTDRINIILDQKVGMPVISLLESFLQYRLNPRYEGFESQHP